MCSIVLDDAIHIKNEILAKDNTSGKFDVRKRYEFGLMPIVY